MGFLSSLFGGGSAPTPPAPKPVQTPAVTVSGSADSKRSQMDMRRRMARSGQSSLRAGGSYGSMGGTMSASGENSGGKTLMGS